MIYSMERDKFREAGRPDQSRARNGARRRDGGGLGRLLAFVLRRPGLDADRSRTIAIAEGYCAARDRLDPETPKRSASTRIRLALPTDFKSALYYFDRAFASIPTSRMIWALSATDLLLHRPARRRRSSSSSAIASWRR